PEPVLIECMTFRMRGHEEASGTKYVPQELFDKWGKKDPIDNYEQYLLRKKVLSQDDVEQIRNEISEEIEAGLEDAFNEPEIAPDPVEEVNDIYMPFDQQVVAPDWHQAQEKRFVDGVSEGLREGMKQHENLIIMGQDVAGYGGVFKVTQGFSEEFGTERVRNTTLCESAIIETGFGLTLTGMKSVIEMQFADFISSGFNAVVNVLAKGYYRWQQNADVVIRMTSGAGVGAGPFHSQSDEAWFFHTPGLKIVFPSNPADAKGLMTAAIEDPNPVLYFEHKAMYRGIKGQLPDGYYTTEIGKAHRIQEGDDVAIITYGMGIHWAQQTIRDHPELSFDLLDLRSLQPLDWEAIDESVKRAGKVIILHEDTKTGGIGAEIAAYITENLFEYLDGPVQRSASLDTPVPFATTLEQQFLPKERFQKDLEQLIDY
ncbi:MAG: dehydrogenase, partial [Bacteroidetes bacterium SW_11_45_7]